MDYELKISQAADMLNVSPSRISQLIKSGTLDSTTILGKRRISKASVEHYRDHVRRTGRPPKARNPLTELILMNGDHEVMLLSHDDRAEDPLTALEVMDPSRAPWGSVTKGGRCKKRELNAWWRSRAIPDIRPGIDSRLAALNLDEPSQIPFKNRGLSLSDCYWLRGTQDDDVLSWPDINYFDNSFDSHETSWDDWLSNVGMESPDNTSEGALPKRWTIKDGVRYMLKGSRSDDQRPCNEVVATILHRRLLKEGDFVPYEIGVSGDGPICMCANFLSSHEEYIPASYIKGTVSNTKGTSVYDRFCRYASTLGMDEPGLREQMCKMIVCDAILANTDRHWRNFGFIRDIDTLELRPAPIFDTGNSLWYSRTTNELSNGDFAFSAKPFGPSIEKQLSVLDSVDWFDKSALDGFVEEASDILSASADATKGDRLDLIMDGLRNQIAYVSQIVGVLAYKA